MQNNLIMDFTQLKCWAQRLFFHFSFLVVFTTVCMYSTYGRIDNKADFDFDFWLFKFVYWKLFLFDFGSQLSGWANCPDVIMKKKKCTIKNIFVYSCYILETKTRQKSNVLTKLYLYICENISSDKFKLYGVNNCQRQKVSFYEIGKCFLRTKMQHCTNHKPKSDKFDIVGLSKDSGV